MAETGVQGLKQFSLLQIELKNRLPRYITHALAKAMYEEGKDFLKDHFRPHLNQAFKTGGRVGRSFHVYTSGRSIDTLTLGIFTIWPLAPLYESGGTIRPVNGKWLVVPVTSRAYTTQGRIKRSWRDPADPNKFRAKLFEGLRPIKVPAGILLVRDRGVTSGNRVIKPTKSRGVEAIEPVFLLIRRTHRDPVLDFYNTFERYAGPRGSHLQGAVDGALKAFVRDTRERR